MEVLSEVSNKLNLPLEVVTTVYKSFYEFIRDKVKELPLKEDLSEEEFNKLRCNFNLPSLGKLYITYDRYVRMKKRFKYINSLRNGEI